MPELAKIEHPKGQVLPDLSAPRTNAFLTKHDRLFAIAVLKRHADDRDKLRKRIKQERQGLSNLGHNLEMLELAIKEEERDDGTTLKNMREFRENLQALGIPLGFQFSLFGDQGDVKAAKPDLEQQAYEDGLKHGLEGATRDTQKWLPISPEGQAYERGYVEGQEMISDRLKNLTSGLTLGEQKKADEKAAKAKAKADAAAAKAAEKEQAKAAKAAEKSPRGRKPKDATADAAKPAEGESPDTDKVH